jgi:quercetin dioxygenase-like cupin family protein
MNHTTFESFSASANAAGFDEVLERRWEAGKVLDTHPHPFDARARLVQGEMWLTVGARPRHLCAGDSFEVAREVPHAERYGADGATYWVARRNAG